MLLANASSPELNDSLSIQQKDTLQRGCVALRVEVSAQQQDLLLAYLELLLKWNKAYNLTAVRDAEQMVTRHLLDSLAVVPYVRAGRGIDVGTGAGLPGVPLAILYPEREFHLLDSNGKKTRFLFQVKTALGLDNMVVHQARVESFQNPEGYDTVYSRAYASLQDMLESCAHLVSSEGRLLAMKGAYPTQELAALGTVGEAAQVHELSVPGLGEQRHLVEIFPQGRRS